VPGQSGAPAIYNGAPVHSAIPVNQGAQWQTGAPTSGAGAPVYAAMPVQGANWQTRPPATYSGAPFHAPTNQGAQGQNGPRKQEEVVPLVNNAGVLAPRAQEMTDEMSTADEASFTECELTSCCRLPRVKGDHTICPYCNCCREAFTQTTQDESDPTYRSTICAVIVCPCCLPADLCTWLLGATPCFMCLGMCCFSDKFEESAGNSCLLAWRRSHYVVHQLCRSHQPICQVLNNNSGKSSEFCQE
jgi:hypothetical protein